MNNKIKEHKKGYRPVTEEDKVWFASVHEETLSRGVYSEKTKTKLRAKRTKWLEAWEFTRRFAAPRSLEQWSLDYIGSR